MKIYIAGKVTGLPYAETSMKFGKYEKELKDQGHEPIVPLNIVNRNDDWHAAMKKCIAALCGCDEIHMLSDWQDSKGATLEHSIAYDLGLTIVYLNGKLKKIRTSYQVGPSRPECFPAKKLTAFSLLINKK